jgi:predicted nucleic acid-binding protein
LKGFLADTNIPSELTRPVPDPRVADFLKDAGRDQVYLSVLTLGEIRKGVASLPAGNRRRLLEAWIETNLRPWFAARILPVTEEIAERWGVLAAEAKLGGFGLSVVDGLVAATALEHDLTLVTRNAKDFAKLGVTIVNPWALP